MICRNYDDVCEVNVSYLNSRNYKNENFYHVQKVVLLIKISQKNETKQEAVSNVEITVTK